MTDTAGQSEARSATEAAGRGQSSPDLLLLPHHLLSFSLTPAGPPASPMAPSSHSSEDIRHPGIMAPTAPSCMATDLPSPGHGAWPGAMKVTGHSLGTPPPRPPPHPCTATKHHLAGTRASLTGLSPAPLPGPLTALGLAGVWTYSSWGMSGTPVLPRGARQAPILQTGRPLPPAPWEGSGGGAGGAQAPRGSRQQPPRCQERFLPGFIIRACPEGEVPASHMGQQPPLEGWGSAGAALVPLCPLSAPVCAQACRARATCALGVHGTSWQSRAATASGSARQRWGQPEPRQGGLESLQDPTLIRPPIHTPVTSVCSLLHPSPAWALPALLPHAPRCARVYPCIHFKFLSSVPSLCTQHQHHR